MKRGSVYWITLEPARPPKVGKVRPAVVVSHSIYNERLDSVVVVPLSSRAPEIWPLRLAVAVSGMKVSFAIIPGVRQISKARLQDFIGDASPANMARITGGLALYLGE